jgi:hypothetical protein
MMLSGALLDVIGWGVITAALVAVGGRLAA